MHSRLSFRPACALAFAALLFASGPLAATPQPAQPERPAFDARAAGARWLVEHQNPDGGWGAGAFGQRHLRGAANSPSDVATTALGVMALMRDAEGGPAHGAAIDRGLRFVLGVVEASPVQGPALQGPNGTQPQHKLGRYVDTHFAALLLGEVSTNPPQALSGRIGKAYDRVLSKVVAAQRADGSFDGDGWAPVLSSSVAAQSLYKAHANGKTVDEQVLARSDEYQRKLVDSSTGRFDASEGAGVDLYAAATSLIGNKQAARRAASPEAEVAAEASADALRSDTGRLVAGFGSVGGEEMLSYMMISDSLAEEGDDDWAQWERKITAQLAATQNGDGSWSGHHCITSTPFVTAAAVMTLGSGPAIQNTQGAKAATQ